MNNRQRIIDEVKTDTTPSWLLGDLMKVLHHIPDKDLEFMEVSYSSAQECIYLELLTDTLIQVRAFIIIEKEGIIYKVTYEDFGSASGKIPGHILQVINEIARGLV